jgi:predicted DNA-binding transcriptional regulator YafY
VNLLSFRHPIEGGVRLRIKVDDLDWYARQLCAAPFDAEIVGPDALRTGVAALAGRIRRMAGASDMLRRR